MNVQTSGRATTPKPLVSQHPTTITFYSLKSLLAPDLCPGEDLDPPAPSLLPHNTGLALPFSLSFVWAIFPWNLISLLAPCDASPHLFTFFHLHHRGLAREARLEASIVLSHTTAPSSNGPTTASCQRTEDLVLSEGCGVCRTPRRNATRSCQRPTLPCFQNKEHATAWPYDSGLSHRSFQRSKPPRRCPGTHIPRGQAQTSLACQ